MILPSKLRQEIVDFLTKFPSFHSENGRKANLLNAGLDKQIPTIDLSGSTTEFVARLVEQLAQYGSLSGRDQALVCLLQSLESQVGLEKQDYIKTLCQRLTAQQTALIENCPYRGLFAFREQDERFFFGRDAYTQKLIAAVQNRHLVAVIGASGSGKSSLVYAGLIPTLRRQGFWHILSFRPGSRPFHELLAAMIPVWQPELFAPLLDFLSLFSS